MDFKSTNQMPNDNLAMLENNLDRTNSISLNSYLRSTIFQSITTDHLAINQSFYLQNDQASALISNSTSNLMSPFEILMGYYSSIHGLLSLCVCIFGIIANLVNILVLTRYLKELICFCFFNF